MTKPSAWKGPQMLHLVASSAFASSRYHPLPWCCDFVGSPDAPVGRQQCRWRLVGFTIVGWTRS